MQPLVVGGADKGGDKLDNVLTAANMLAGLLRDLGTGRAGHPSSQADASVLGRFNLY